MDYFFKDLHTKKYWTFRVFFQEPQRIFNPIKVFFFWNNFFFSKNDFFGREPLIILYFPNFPCLYRKLSRFEKKQGNIKLGPSTQKGIFWKKKNISSRNRSIFDGFISSTIRPANHEFEWLFSNKIMGMHLQQYFLGTSKDL